MNEAIVGEATYAYFNGAAKPVTTTSSILVSSSSYLNHAGLRALVAAVPDMETDLDRPLAVIPGRPVDPADVPAGCAFAARCPLATEHCRTEEPPLQTDAFGRRVACWYAGAPTDLHLAHDEPWPLEVP